MGKWANDRRMKEREGERERRGERESANNLICCLRAQKSPILFLFNKK
jgi:hypothetical protein